MTVAFQFAFEDHLQDNIATMARQYVRSIIASVQRVALALSPSNFGSQNALRPPPGSPEAQTLAQWICNSYRCYLGVELLKCKGSESILNSIWHHSDAVMCCSLKFLRLQINLGLTCLRQPWLLFKTSLLIKSSMTMDRKPCSLSSPR